VLILSLPESPLYTTKTMTELSKYEQGDDIHNYEGVPKKYTKKELSAWTKFWHKVMPWLEKKNELGERFLAAKVLNEEAKAMDTLADAALKMAKAKKIRAETAILEEEKLKTIDLTVVTEGDIEHKMLEIQERIKYLEAVHGVRLSIGIDGEKPKADKSIESEHPSIGDTP
jgi:hypothetical protein